MFIAPLLALGLATQFVEGNYVDSEGCFSVITSAETMVVAANVGTAYAAGTQSPKQGDVFYVYINVLAFPQPCGTSLTVRPGFKLPPGLELAPTTGAGSTPTQCFMGAPGHMTQRTCPSAPTQVAADGTLIFDAPSGLWQIPDQQQLQIDIPVRGRAVSTGQLVGSVDFAAFDFQRSALHPTVPVTVFLNPPSVSYPTGLEVTGLGSYVAHVHGYVDPHFNAGTVRLEVAPANEHLAVVDQAHLDADQFENNVDEQLEDLLPDTDYDFRFSYQMDGSASVTAGAIQHFHTFAPPRFLYSQTVTGAGSIVASVPSVGNTYADRTEVTFAAVPAPGNELVEMRVNGTLVDGDTASVTVSGALHIDATFDALPAPAGEGEGEGEGAVTSPEGSNDTATDPENDPSNDSATDPAGDPANDASSAPSTDPAGDAASDPAADDGATDPANGGDTGAADDGAPGAGGLHHVPADQGDAGSDAGSDAGEAGGCAAAKPAGVPVACLMFLIACRRRRRRA